MPWNWRTYLKFMGEKGTIFALNPFLPHAFNFLRIKKEESTRYEFFDRKRTSYDYQLSFFLEAVRLNKTLDFEGAQSIKNLKVIDRVYEIAGLKKRGL